MDALNVISLEDAKKYLRVDYGEDDAIITRLIKTSVSWVEEYTNIMMYNRDKTYTVTSCGSIEIYDYPLTLADTSLRKRQNVLSLTVYDKEGETIASTVGYTDVSDVPTQLIDACYKLITYLYENRDSYQAGIPTDIQTMINQLRRSATI